MRHEILAAVAPGKPLPPLESEGDVYAWPSQFRSGAEAEELLIMARAVWRARQTIYEEAERCSVLAGLPGRKASEAASLLLEATEAYRCAVSAEDLRDASASIHAVLSWYNSAVRLAIRDKADWPRKDLSALARKLGAPLLPPATPCEFVEESLCWWAFGQHDRGADWLGHGYFWRPIPRPSPDFKLENAAGNAMNDFDCLEDGFCPLAAKVLAADYPLLRCHFPELQGRSNSEVDKWLVQEAAWLSEGQAQRLAEGGDHHHLITSGGSLLAGSRSGIRAKSGGRAATFIVSDQYRIDELGNFRANMLDVKGVGTHVKADISSEKVTGLLGLADALREMAFQRLVQRLLDLEGLSDVMGTVPYYAILDTGLVYSGINPATGWTGESCVLLVRQRQSRLFDAYDGMNFSGVCPDAVHSVGFGREMRRILHSWGVSAEFEPRAVFHGQDASADEVLLCDQSGTWNLQADAACTHFMDFSDFYVLPMSPLPEPWRMSEEALKRAFSLERSGTSDRALACPQLSERLWGHRDRDSAAAACLELRQTLSKQKELRDAAAAVDDNGLILPMKPKYCMCVGLTQCCCEKSPGLCSSKLVWRVSGRELSDISRVNQLAAG